MFFLLSKTLDALLCPLTWSAALIAMGIVAKGRSFAVLGLALLLLFSMEPVANALERGLERTASRTYRPDVVYDAVILLGGLVDAGG